MDKAYSKHRVECSAVIDNSIRMHLRKKLEEFDRSDCELGSFAGIIIYDILKKSNQQIEMSILNYYLTEALAFQQKHPISARKKISVDERKSKHMGVVRFAVTDAFNDKLWGYANDLTELGSDDERLTGKITKSALIYAMLCFARDNDLPRHRSVDYQTTADETGLNERLVKDVMIQME